MTTPAAPPARPQAAPGNEFWSPLPRLRRLGRALARPLRLPLLPTLTVQARVWLSVFSVSLTLLLIRFLVPTPVGQSDNRDGPRLMCGVGLHMAPVVPRGDPRFFDYIFFGYAPSKVCNGLSTYPSSELVPLEAARFLTPVLGLRGTLNLIALGVVMCVLISVGIASLAAGLRMRWWGQVLVAAALWLVMADAAFFDVDAGPFSEPAALVGLLLFASGVVYLGRGRRATIAGLALAGTGGFLAICSKEQYVVLAAPICLTLVLAGADRPAGAGWRARFNVSERFRTRRAAAAAGTAIVLAAMAGGYILWDETSPYAAHLHQVQAVDMIFDDIVNGHDNAPADLRALGLPVSWSKYAGDYYWDTVSVRDSPLLGRYRGKLSDGNIAQFLVTHPRDMVSIAQQSAVYAQQFRLNSLGDYPPGSGHPPGAVESRVAVVSWLMGRLPAGLGLLWLLPLWAAMTGVAVAALRLRRPRPPAGEGQAEQRCGPAWYRDGAAAVLFLTGCAVAAFIAPAFFAGISTTRHMVGMNLATMLALVLSLALAVSMAGRKLSRRAAG